MVAPTRAFFDTSVLPEEVRLSPAVAWHLVEEEILSRFLRVCRVPVVVTDNLRHFAALRRHGVDVMSAAQFAETISA